MVYWIVLGLVLLGVGYAVAGHWFLQRRQRLLAEKSVHELTALYLQGKIQAIDIPHQKYDAVMEEVMRLKGW